MASIETAIYRPTLDGDEIEIEVEVVGDYVPYTPARTYGDPENCSPAEGGYAEDVTAIFSDNGKPRAIPLTKDEVDMFTEQLADAADDEAEARYEDAMEARYEMSREMDEYEKDRFD